MILKQVTENSIMAKYTCPLCKNYSTNYRKDLDKHMNERKKPCSPNKQHGNYRQKVNLVCEKCGDILSREDALLLHIRAYHSGTKKNKEISTNISLKRFDDHSINDLTLFEQYSLLTSSVSPYIILLDLLNLNPAKSEHHNIQYRNNRLRTMKVYDGKDWIESLWEEAIPKIITAKRNMIKAIYDKFYIFLSDNASESISTDYNSYDFNSSIRNATIRRFKNYLYDNKKMNLTEEVTMSENRNHKMWWALDENFSWPEVEALMNKLEKYEIKYDGNPKKIYREIIKVAKGKPKLKFFFKKLLNKISMLDDDYEKNDEN